MSINTVCRCKDKPFLTSMEEPLSTVEETGDTPNLRQQIKKQIEGAIAAEQYEEVISLYDKLLELCIEELKEQKTAWILFDDYKLAIENEIAESKSYYLILTGQIDRAIELSTSLIQRMQSSKMNGFLFSDRGLLQIRAAAFLIEGNKEQGIKDLIESGREEKLPALGAIFDSNNPFEQLLNQIVLKILGQKLETNLVEIKTVSTEELNQMVGWEKADYFLARDLPSEALDWVDQDEKRKAIALAQLGLYTEALILVEWFDPKTAAVIYFMQNDLEKAKSWAQEEGNWRLLSLIHYFQCQIRFN